jgi:hypothetical protein
MPTSTRNSAAEREKLIKLQAELQAANEKIVAFETKAGKFEEMELANHSLRQQEEIHLSKIKELESELLEAKSEIQSLSDVMTTNKNLEKEKNELCDQKLALKAEVEKLKESSPHDDMEEAELQQSISMMTSMAETSAEQIELLQSQLQTAQEELTTLQEKYSKAEEKLRKAESQPRSNKYLALQEQLYNSMKRVAGVHQTLVPRASTAPCMSCKSLKDSVKNLEQQLLDAKAQASGKCTTCKPYSKLLYESKRSQERVSELEKLLQERMETSRSNATSGMNFQENKSLYRHLSADIIGTLPTTDTDKEFLQDRANELLKPANEKFLDDDAMSMHSKLSHDDGISSYRTNSASVPKEFPKLKEKNGSIKGTYIAEWVGKVTEFQFGLGAHCSDVLIGRYALQHLSQKDKRINDTLRHNIRGVAATWTVISTQLLLKYHSDTMTRFYTRRFLNLKQGPGESYEKFYSRFLATYVTLRQIAPSSDWVPLLTQRQFLMLAMCKLNSATEDDLHHQSATLKTFVVMHDHLCTVESNLAVGINASDSEDDTAPSADADSRGKRKRDKDKQSPEKAHADKYKLSKEEHLALVAGRCFKCASKDHTARDCTTDPGTLKCTNKHCRTRNSPHDTAVCKYRQA